MLAPGLIDDIKVHIFNASKIKVGHDWNYSNIVSPFSRIYLIMEGDGVVMPNQNMHQLKPGYLYLIPSYTLCSYHCVDPILQYYVHFSHQLSDGVKIFDRISIKNEVKAMDIDYALFDRLLEINPHINLKFSDPNVYEQRNWYSNEVASPYNNVQLETIGILKQLFSRFIQNESTKEVSLKTQYRLTNVFQHIATHLYREIKLDELAEIACCSKDHFSRQFKKTTGMLPNDYINVKRIEKAQELLITTAKSQKQISEEAGFNSQQYYTRIFKKLIGTTPAEYRKMGGLI
ncbi:helix-turn-helix transcriptional regulator [Labilibacter marinus]|uniref:helix-turn-helix transcriptional regulator n=1 Tax=Labilibacter marinus TaxID=1477105 RepID=UPI00082DC61D|nr:helix-turn-helix transcriptional regulator [Labilibacter marinus]